MRHSFMDVNLFGSPLHTPRSMLWNMRRLGVLWWAASLVLNSRIAIDEWRDVPVSAE
jgi:hypothetical protein